MGGFYVRHIPRIFLKYRESKRKPVVEEEPKEKNKDNGDLTLALPIGNWLLSLEKDRLNMIKKSILWMRMGDWMNKKREEEERKLMMWG